MVKIGLQFKAFLENVTGLIADGEDFRLVVGFRTLMPRFFCFVFTKTTVT